jgi:hypothetical protein
MSAQRFVEWASVEFQPNLTSLQKPVKLGAIVCAKHPNGELELVLIGRLPRLDARPQEFKSVGNITMQLASAWMDNMLKDILEAKPKNIFDCLAKRWRWNLYLTNPKQLRSVGERETLEAIGKRLYQKLTGEPFRMPSVARATRSVPSIRPIGMPSPWALEEFKKRQLEIHV